MKLALLIAVAVAAGPAAQGTQRGAGSTADRVTVSGCVERAQPNGSVAGTAVGTSSSPNTADRDANTSQPLDAFLLTGASATTQAAKGELKTYALEGHESELGGHTGHRVEVTGRLAPPRSSGQGAGRAAATTGVQRIVVEAVKMIETGCSAKVNRER